MNEGQTTNKGLLMRSKFFHVQQQQPCLIISVERNRSKAADGPCVRLILGKGALKLLADCWCFLRTCVHGGFLFLCVHTGFKLQKTHLLQLLPFVFSRPCPVMGDDDDGAQE